MSNSDIALQMKDICKYFPGVKALDHVGFEVKKGEVHVLLGENGAGKSTLMKILSGVYPKDGGEIFLEGEPVEIHGVKEAQALGISIIHQELNMLTERDIAQNIFLGREPVKNKLNAVDTKKMYADSSALLQKLDIDLNPKTMIKDLSIAQQQMVEVVKALSIQTKILIMDEPTSSLTQKEIDRLFSIVRSLRDSGISIVYISHRMEEIFEIGDRVTVMRDGKYIDTVNVRETDMSRLISMMVGRTIDHLYSRTYHTPGEEALRTENLTGLRFRNVNISLHRGEIVGLAGLVGAGRTELVKAIFGYDPIDSGTILLNGKKVKRHSPKELVENGLVLIPEDRKNEGLVVQEPIKNNIVQASLRKLFKNHIVNKEVERKTAEKYHADLHIASSGIVQKVESLSGGNQQKVVLGKWLCTGCNVLIFDEPTRGIDVGAKAEIYELMNQLVGEGYAILMISSDQMELLGMSDRIYVMCEGEITGELSKEDATPALLLSYSIGKGGIESE
ncbi:sugar ABC transporter ATP-binding protein [Clostridium sp. KNHs216]|uniref:sugar ABC transporter ATP-binding protein n=1 Tax=Clostridium sp. KNHs216 TaxID=1550235 RepID=UPI00116DB8FB|nr:ribose transport system ATP-binding protein [Clostridium sp. KNHs216]